MNAVRLHALLLLGFCSLAVGQTIPAWFSKAPPLPPPVDEVLHVSNTEELFVAVDRLPSGGTILLADGRYTLTRPIVLNGKKGVVLRSASQDASRVTLTGKGWELGDEHDDILQIGGCEG